MDSSEVVAQMEAYHLFLSLDAKNTKTDLVTFHRLSAESGIKSRKGKRVLYHAIPISSDSQAMHSHGPTSTVYFHLANIQNLITKVNNKCPFLHNLTQATDMRILAITETALKQSKHNNVEITRHFQNHHLLRQDRKEKPCNPEAEEDVDHLSKSGGCLLLSSHRIPLEPVDRFSNGNVELIIAESPTLGISIILIYNPPSNFSLNKFKEGMGRVSRYLNKNQGKVTPLEVILTGDLNFPSDIVTWEESDVGVTPLPHHGCTPRKKGFEILCELTEKHGLTQMVDKNTRLNETLDLLYTSNPLAFSSCATTILYPESDHNLVTFAITINLQQCTQEDAHNYTPNVPEIATFDFHSANKERLNQALQATNWMTTLDPPSNITSFSKNFVAAIVSAAKTAKVPKYSHRKQNTPPHVSDPILASLTRKHKDLTAALTNPALTNSDRDTMANDIHATNEAPRARLEIIQEAEEIKVANAVKGNSKAFFAFAKRNMKMRPSVGPLKEGSYFYSGPKKMADILSNQFEGAFSTPLDDYSHITFREALCDDLTDKFIQEQFG